MIYQREIQLRTTGHRQMHDLTAEIAQVVSASRVRTGVANIFNVGSTGAIGTIEFEPGLQQDLPAMLDKLFPPSPDYGHEEAWHDGNGHSHLQATMLGPSLTVPIKEGNLVLGTWQQVFHLECDVKPRQRTIVITVIMPQLAATSFEGANVRVVPLAFLGDLSRQVALVWNRKMAEVRPAIAKYSRLLPAMFRMDGR